MYRTLTNSNYRLTKQLFMKYSAGATTLGLINSCIPFITDQYKNIGPLCWISAEVLSDTGPKPGFAMQMSLEYCQVPIIILMNAFLYYRIYKYMHGLKGITNANTSEDSGASKAERTIRRLRYYPCILSVCWLGMIAMRVSQFITDSMPFYSYAITEVRLKDLICSICCDM